MSALPQLTVSAQAAKRLHHYDCWVFRDELPARLPDGLASGDAVELTDAHGTFLGYAWYSATAHVAARLISRDRQQPPGQALFEQRIAQAVARRAGLTGTNAKRLMFSEADGLPGFIVDQYADIVVYQSRTAGIERHKPLLIDLLQRQLAPSGIMERSDKEFRDEEGLPPIAQVVRGTVPDRIPIEEDGLKFLVDPRRGHKTGFYLDQRDTRRSVRAKIQPGQQVLDAFAYTGAFGIAAASAGARVTCLEQDEGHVALGKDQAALNRAAHPIEWVAGDAFYWLDAAAKTPRRYDWVLLDPPGLAKSKTEVSKARHALHRLLVPALRLLADDGTLVFSLCTYHLLPLAEEMLRIAAADANRRLIIRALSLQATDHPWVLHMPVTRYLMSWSAQSA